MTPDARMVTAYHEAGHAAFAHHLGYRIDRITLVPDDEGLGRCDYSPVEPHLDQADARALIAVAGIVAEGIVSRTTDPLAALTDLLRIASILTDLGVHNEGAVEACFRAVSDVVAEKWPTVHAIAQALLAHGELGGDHVRAIIKDADPP